LTSSLQVPSTGKQAKDETEGGEVVAGARRDEMREETKREAVATDAQSGRKTEAKRYD